MADATAQVKLVARAGSLDEARQMMLTGRASGIFCTFPAILSGSDAGQERDPGIYAGDASHFLVYGTTLPKGWPRRGGTLAAR